VLDNSKARAEIELQEAFRAFALRAGVAGVLAVTELDGVLWGMTYARRLSNLTEPPLIVDGPLPVVVKLTLAAWDKCWGIKMDFVP